MKKLIAALTSCALCVSAFSVTAFAQESTDSWEVAECGDTQMANYRSISGLPDAEPNCPVKMTSSSSSVLSDTTNNVGKGSADLIIAFAESLVDTSTSATFGVASNIITSINNFTQKIELTNGSLFFNDYVPVANDIAYFNPDTTHTERWDLKQVTEYLGTSFYPSYIPETLKLCEDFYSETFISEYIDKSMYWTVAFEGDADSPVYDNFGLFYSDSFDDEYNPLRKNLYIEVSKNKIPESDTVYSYETTEKSKIGNTELTIGLYKAPYYDGKEEPTGYSEYFVAEFMVDNVGYRIKSENLSQADFINILTSISVFQ